MHLVQSQLRLGLPFRGYKLPVKQCRKGQGAHLPVMQDMSYLCASSSSGCALSRLMADKLRRYIRPRASFQRLTLLSPARGMMHSCPCCCCVSSRTLRRTVELDDNTKLWQYREPRPSGNCRHTRRSPAPARLRTAFCVAEITGRAHLNVPLCAISSRPNEHGYRQRFGFRPYSEVQLESMRQKLPQVEEKLHQ